MASKSDVKTHEFLMGMTCEGCAGAAKRVLKKIEVEEDAVKIDLDAKTVTITTEKSREELETALKKTGKTIEYKGTK